MKEDFVGPGIAEENPRYQEIKIPADPQQQWRLLRALMNVRPSMPIVKNS